MKPTHTLIKILALLNEECNRKQDALENGEGHYPEDSESISFLKGMRNESNIIRNRITQLIYEELKGGDTP